VVHHASAALERTTAQESHCHGMLLTINPRGRVRELHAQQSTVGSPLSADPEQPIVALPLIPDGVSDYFPIGQEAGQSVGGQQLRHRRSATRHGTTTRHDTAYILLAPCACIMSCHAVFTRSSQSPLHIHVLAMVQSYFRDVSIRGKAICRQQ
jgi:hypothetical protein